MSTEITYQFGTVGVVNDKVLDFKRDLIYESLKVRAKRKYTAYNYSGISLINTNEFLKFKRNCLKAKNFEMEIYPKLIKKAMMKNIVGFWHSTDNLKDLEALNRNKKKLNYIKTLKKLKHENKRYIRLFKPSVDNYEIRSIGKVFKKAWLGYGEQVHKFEKQFSKFIGTKYALGLNSCTSALHLSLAVNNFKKEKSTSTL